MHIHAVFTQVHAVSRSIIQYLVTFLLNSWGEVVGTLVKCWREVVHLPVFGKIIHVWALWPFIGSRGCAPTLVKYCKIFT
jgi:hypothetical protein